jgi:DNA helicase-2/ATP-dependent DNA helicase PcrA
MAVLYRTNAQSRQFEEIFRRDRIPHQVVGSVQFYERKEIRDVLAYLKLAANDADPVAFRRTVNTPSRGIGDGTLKVLEGLGQTRAVPLEAAARAAVAEALVPGRQARELRRFLDLIDDLRRRAASAPVADLLREVVERTAYAAFLDRTHGAQGAERFDNVRALISAAAEYHEEAEVPSVADFLERLALVSDADDVGREPGVSLMTIHCAKGLEFQVVFLPGLEENLFPHARSVNHPDDLEEERRLCYVAMTRARDRLFLSRAETRMVQGVRTPNPPSRFLDEIPRDLLEEEGYAPADGVTEPGFWRSQAETWHGSSAARAPSRARHGADAASVPRLQPDPGDGFPVGARVTHPRFGSGQIMDREGAGKGLKLTIQFAEYGSKKILPAYTELRVHDAGAARDEEGIRR